MQRKRILLFSEGFGSGHTKAAQALSVSLKQSSEIRTRVLELGQFLHPLLMPLVFNAYRKTVEHSPRLYGRMYRANQHKALNRPLQLALHRVFYAQAGKIVKRLRPDLIVCTHPFPNIVVSRLKRMGLDVPLCTVITDYDAHGTWINPEVDKYLVPTADIRKKFIDRGVPEASVEVTGIPVHPVFSHIHNKAEVRARFGLHDLPTVLVMGGGWGMVDRNNFLDPIAGWRERLQIVICLGSNQKALDELAADPVYRHPNIRLLGFTREVDQWMDAADLLITKPGGMTCSEGLAKGIPMLFYEAIPGQEEENLHYFTDNGLGELIRTSETIERRFTELLARYDELTASRQRLLQSTGGRFSHLVCTQAILQLLS